MLKGRKVILYPDLGAFEKWCEKARMIEQICLCVVSVSNVIEYVSTPDEKGNGLDIADFIFTELKSRKFVLKIQSHRIPYSLPFE